MFNRYDFEPLNFKGCLLNIVKLVVILFLLFFVFSKLGCEHQKTAPQIEIVLTTTTPIIKMDQRPQFSISLVNRGKKSVTLVKPGDGSLYGWRTPIISWSGINDDYPPPRCGNINGLKKDEVFKMDPGKIVQLSGWIHPPLPLQRGTYQVAFNYANVPELEWSGLLGSPDWFVMRRVRNSTPFEGTSNTVKIVVD